MIGRPFRVDWRREDSPESLKAAYLAERDANLRTRLHGLWLLRSGRQLSAVASVLGSIIGRYRHGWAGIEMEVWGKCCPTRREAEAHRAF